MAHIVELESLALDLSCAIKNFVTLYHETIHSTKTDTPLHTHPEAQEEARRARESALAITLKIQTILAEHSDFLQQMSIQGNSEFQVPAHIPPVGTALMTDVSDLIGIPVDQLRRTIRMTSMAGSLQETEPDHVAHTELSAAFLTNPAYLDATMFLARKVAPAALGMAPLTKQHFQSASPVTKCNTSDQNVSNSISIFSDADKTQQPRLERQWHAYLRYGLGHFCDTSIDILACLDSIQTTNSCIVEVGARSTGRGIALANRYPNLHFTIQIVPGCQLTSRRTSYTPSTPKIRHPRINIQPRVSGTPQSIPNAAVYILNLPLPQPGASSTHLATQIKTELQMHLDVLRMSPSAILVLVTPSLLDHHLEEGIDRRLETLAQMKNLSFFQLGIEKALDISEIMDLLNAVGDSEGRLVVIRKMKYKGVGGGNGATAIEVKYQAYADLIQTSMF